MALSGALILFGVWQLYRRGASWTCAAIVVAMIVAPQFVAGLLAGS
jgi:hypothetical protein